MLVLSTVVVVNDAGSLNYRAAIGLFTWKQHERVLSALMQLFCPFHDKVSSAQHYILVDEYLMYMTLYMHRLLVLMYTYRRYLLVFGIHIQALPVRS